MRKANMNQIMKISRNLGAALPCVTHLGVPYKERVSLESAIWNVGWYANAGFLVMRIFNCSGDYMRYPGEYIDNEFKIQLKRKNAGYYNQDYFDYLKKDLSNAFFRMVNGKKMQIMIPMLSLLGYVRMNIDKIEWDRWINYIIPESIQVMKDVFGDLFFVEIGNEIFKLALHYPKKSKKTGKYRKLVDEIGMMCEDITNKLVELGVPRNRIYHNCNDDTKYPDAISTADAMAGASVNYWSKNEEPSTKLLQQNCNLMYHGIHHPQDIHGNDEGDTGLRRMEVSVGVTNFSGDTDGSSVTSTPSNGLDPSAAKKGQWQEPSEDELYDVARAFFGKIRFGVKWDYNLSIEKTKSMIASGKSFGHKKHGNFFVLPRYHFLHDIHYYCKDCKYDWWVYDRHAFNDRPKTCPKCKSRKIDIKPLYAFMNDTIFKDGSMTNPGIEISLAVIRAWEDVFEKEAFNKGRWEGLLSPIEWEEQQDDNEDENNNGGSDNETPEEPEMPELKPWKHLIPKFRFKKPFIIIDVINFWKEAKLVDKICAIESFILFILFIVLLFKIF